MGKGGGLGDYTRCFWCLCTAATVAFALVVVGHVLDGSAEASEPGELPVWYHIEACQNTTGMHPLRVLPLCYRGPRENQG